ncbi:MAG: hypothetical protein OEU50_16440 [Gammaproteobacteria bacterium]|nr:hypothetical protein [Gammaproteobacteria bacterium]
MRSLLTAAVICVLPVFYPVQAQQLQSVNDVTGARSWSRTHAGVYFSLTQILPEQGDAFYVNRGFSLEQIRPFTTSCVYMTVLRNDSAPGIVHFVRGNWSISVDGEPREFKTVDQWVKKLTAAEAGKPALIAFRWAQFPPEQEYEPGGDWNQGMLSVGLPAGQVFDITARWDLRGQSFEATLTGVECAK